MVNTHVKGRSVTVPSLFSHSGEENRAFGRNVWTLNTIPCMTQPALFGSRDGGKATSKYPEKPMRETVEKLHGFLRAPAPP